MLQFWRQKVIDVRGTSFQRKRLITCAGDWLRTITSDQIFIQRLVAFFFELVGMITPDRNYCEVNNKLIIYSARIILEYTWNWQSIAILGQKILDVRGKRLIVTIDSNLAPNSNEAKIKVRNKKLI